MVGLKLTLWVNGTPANLFKLTYVIFTEICRQGPNEQRSIIF